MSHEVVVVAVKFECLDHTASFDVFPQQTWVANAPHGRLIPGPLANPEWPRAFIPYHVPVHRRWHLRNELIRHYAELARDGFVRHVTVDGVAVQHAPPRRYPARRRTMTKLYGEVHG